MRSHLVPNYLLTTDLAADAMISEGGALQQPTISDARATYARLGRRFGNPSALLHDWVHSPAAMFWTGFAAGLAISLLDHKVRYLDPRA